MSTEALLEVRNLTKLYPAGNGRHLRAVDGVSFSVHRGETLGIVGESGCGKTTCGKTSIGMLPKTGGQVTFDGLDVHALSRSQRKAFSRSVQMVFQDPYASLDPQQRVYTIVAEGIRIHRLAPNRMAERAMVSDLLEQVGLSPACANQHVHEFSGGQRQRVGIARALSVGPRFLLCDEPVSALDVSLQAQIVNLLLRLQRERKITMLFIAHDLAVVKHVSDRVGVMYLGKLVEIAPTEALYTRPRHPYTQALMAAAPIPDPQASRSRPPVPIHGEPPSPLEIRSGCAFSSRCPYAHELCTRTTPVLTEVAPGHSVACHRR